MEHYTMNLTLKVWRQKNRQEKGHFETYDMKDILSEMSFLEMFDVLNERLILENKEPVVFDQDCREGICGACSMYIDGRAHGPWQKNTVCQLHMRAYKDGDTIVVEPWRSAAFPIIKDLMVDRKAFDRIIEAGGFISVNTGNAVDANSTPVDRAKSEEAFDSATCIGCGACVAACPNSSAVLFVGAKISQLALLPQGDPERKARVINMVDQMDKEGFGNCGNIYNCEAECPKGISVENIARMNREYLGAFSSSEMQTRPNPAKHNGV
ncbi:succinate dehydrogenase/fumarate reductase iron-sulfur subunit [Mucilaginibacter flavidus]|uniref:succinate dehydrogenase/fumarate reductase iron-sulfur subunit n=1 Tax=Mucilaginibacter flavidus TaxID=2949309 RepID=UPI0020931919|nr:succinate dehydrogenase/fumarate reductase iron-sulfur subunit [Mucilaginibacter flavidus]MCO5948582.1 succinate dehydrogenase/fumarate reductase iron-sulfur subunit [Mucilaginibacter flavidus]